MPYVTELAYIGLNVSDIAAWEEYARDILGFEVFREENDDRLYLRLDEHHHRFVLHDGGDDQVAYFGLRVTDDTALQDLRDVLDENGYGYDVATPEEARDRRVLELIRLHDKMGFPVEIFHGPEILPHRPFHPGRPMFGKFNTRLDQGLGHCNFGTTDSVATRKLARLLGFRGDLEYLVAPDDSTLGTSYFMHCNNRDHTIAFKQVEKTQVVHISAEFTDLRDLGHSLDIVNASKWELREGLGMHANDRMVTFYIETPSGWAFEFSWGGRDSRDATEYYAKDVFGH